MSISENDYYRFVNSVSNRGVVKTGKSSEGMFIKINYSYDLSSDLYKRGISKGTLFTNTTYSGIARLTVYSTIDMIELSGSVDNIKIKDKIYFNNFLRYLSHSFGNKYNGSLGINKYGDILINIQMRNAKTFDELQEYYDFLEACIKDICESHYFSMRDNHLEVKRNEILPMIHLENWHNTDLS